MSGQTDAFLSLPRPAPEPYAFTRRFWEATREKQLLVQYCMEAGRYQFPPRPVSVFTGRRSLEWRPVSGRGELFTFTVARRGTPLLRGLEPYLIAVVTLDVGVNVIGNLVSCAPDEARIGMAVQPAWAPLADGFHLLMFEPAAG